jgi:hypothetical protein
VASYQRYPTKQAFAVVHVGAVAGVLDGATRRGLRVVGREGRGELPGGVDVAEEHARQRGSGGLAGVPGLDHRADLVQPGHGDRAGAVEHDHGTPVGGGHRGDELVLVGGQGEGAAVHPFGGRDRHHHDRDVGGVRGRGGLVDHQVLLGLPAQMQPRRDRELVDGDQGGLERRDLDADRVRTRGSGR